MNSDNASLLEYAFKELKQENFHLKDKIEYLSNTEIKKQEDLLNLQSAALEAAANCIIITDVNGKINWVNSAFTELTGFTPQEIYDKNHDILKSDFHDESFYAKLWETILKGHIWSGELLNKKKDGTIYNEEMIINPVKNKSGEITNFIAIKKDITERKKVENNIKDNNKLLNDVLESITQPLYVINIEDYTVELGNSASNFNAHEIKKCFQHTHFTDKPCASQNHPCPIGMIKNTKKPYTVEHVHFDSDGNPINVEVHGYPILNAEGDVEKIIEYSVDVTKRKKVENELKENQYKFDQLIQNSTLGLIRLDTNGKIIMANPAMVKLLDYNNEEELLAQKTNDIFTSSSNRDRFLQIIKREEKIKAFEDNLFKKDKTKIDVRESAWIVKDKDQKPIYYEVLVEDITEQNQILRILHEAEFKYRILMDKLHEAVYLIIGRKFEIVNSKFLELLEITEEDIRKPGFNMFDFMDEESKKIVLEREIKVTKGIQVSPKYEIRLITKSGVEKEVEISVSYLKIKNKSAIQGIVRDLTEIRKSETQIRHLQKMEAIGTLAAGIAHEINTPSQFLNDNLNFLKNSQVELQPIFEFIAKLKSDDLDINDLRKISENIDVEYLKNELPLAIEQSLKGVDRIAKIVGAMRDFSHAGPKEKVSTDIHKLLQNSIIISRNEWKYIAELETEYDESIPQLICSASELGQVFVNIIINASHALEDKFKEQESIKGKIKIKTINNSTNVEIRICDNGIGMTNKVKERIFEPFFTTKDVGKGTGQGLAIAYDIIVNKHNGKIEVETVKNEGTDFIIKLPINEETTI